MSSKQEKHEWELPHLREAHQVPALAGKEGGGDLWSAKFYPYTEPGVDPIFAVVGNEYILICRPPLPGTENKTTEVILSILDDDPETNNFACAWTKDLETGVPLLCVAGKSATIKIINALTGELHRTLTGHGGEINDLQISPVNPQILASGCEDSTVRIWSLDPAHAKHPCAAILAGDGHRETVLSLSFHATGRYLLSGGIDHIINLWALPEFPGINTGTNTATQIHYPHFSTSEIHTTIVDCVSFCGDLILSKSDTEQCIVLWSINGFSSTNQPPLPSSAPTTHDSQRDTRSAFTSSQDPYTRLIQFSIQDAEIIFQRFSLYPGSATTNPVLAFCTGGSKVFFWDLARFEEYHDYMISLPRSPSAVAPVGVPNATNSFSSNSSGTASTTGPSSNPPHLPKRPSFLVPFRHRTRGGAAVVPANPRLGATVVSAISRVRYTSPTESTSSHHTGSDSHTTTTATTNTSAVNQSIAQAGEKGLSEQDWEKSKENWGKRYNLGKPWTNLTPHKEEVVKGLDFTGRQVAWSNGGEWCVVVGSAGVMAVFERWAK